METRTKNARVHLRDARTGIELPVMRLKDTALVLARMDQPGPVRIFIETSERTRVSAKLDGVEVLNTDAMLAPGRHELSSDALVFRPNAPPQAVATTVDQALEADREYLAGLGVEPDVTPAFEDKPYVGAQGGVLALSLGYYVEDNGQEFQQDHDEFVIKLNAADDFDLAIADNAHRILFSKDPDAVDQPPLCATCNLHMGHHHH
jgi:hypothetical protein